MYEVWCCFQYVSAYTYRRWAVACIWEKLTLLIEYRLCAGSICVVSQLKDVVCTPKYCHVETLECARCVTHHTSFCAQGRLPTRRAGCVCKGNTYIYTFVWIYTHICIRKYIFTHPRMYTRIRVYVCMYTHTCLHISIHICVPLACHNETHLLLMRVCLCAGWAPHQGGGGQMGRGPPSMMPPFMGPGMMGGGGWVFVYIFMFT